MHKLLKSAALAVLAGACMVGAASAADLPGSFAPPAPMFTQPGFSWTGFYAGLSAGTSVSDRVISASTLFGTSYQRNSGGGVIGGGQIGYNYSLGYNFVVGAEADFSGTNFAARDETSSAFGGLSQVDSSLDWIGTARGRLGYSWDRFLVYGTGGFAYGHTDLSVVSPAFGAYTSSGVKTGYAVGGGVDYAVTNNVSVGVEYLYTQLARNSIYVPTAGFGGLYATTGNQNNIARVVLNYKFY